MSLNLKNMRRLVRHLRSRNNPVGFGMPKYFTHNGRELTSAAAICRAAETHPCGTVACIAGHAALLAWQSGDIPKRRNVSVQDVASDWLGLDNIAANALFLGYWNNKSRLGLLSDLTKSQAIAELNRLIKAA